MHQNEIKITTDNVAELLKIASELSESHVAALDEQIKRQAESK
jgi:hypothetical protein